MFFAQHPSRAQFSKCLSTLTSPWMLAVALASPTFGCLMFQSGDDSSDPAQDDDDDADSDGSQSDDDDDAADPSTSSTSSGDDQQSSDNTTSDPSQSDESTSNSDDDDDNDDATSDDDDDDDGSSDDSTGGDDDDDNDDATTDDDDDDDDDDDETSEDSPCDDPALEWRSGAKTMFESYPDPDSDECTIFNGCEYIGHFAACHEQRTEQWVMDHNIVAVFPDFQDLKLHDLCLRYGDSEIVVTVLDTCADSDCSGCCSNNQGSMDQLIDIEYYTAMRFGLDDNAEIEWADLGPTAGSGCD